MTTGYLGLLKNGTFAADHDASTTSMTVPKHAQYAASTYTQMSLSYVVDVVANDIITFCIRRTNGSATDTATLSNVRINLVEANIALAEPGEIGWATSTNVTAADFNFYQPQTTLSVIKASGAWDIYANGTIVCTESLARTWLLIVDASVIQPSGTATTGYVGILKNATANGSYSYNTTSGEVVKHVDWPSNKYVNVSLSLIITAPAYGDTYHFAVRHTDGGAATILKANSLFFTTIVLS